MELLSMGTHGLVLGRSEHKQMTLITKRCRTTLGRSWKILKLEISFYIGVKPHVLPYNQTFGCFGQHDGPTIRFCTL